MCSPDTKMVLIGDFNVDLLDSSHFLFEELADLKASHNLNQHVSQPTWFGHGKPSLLDHIYTNNLHFHGRVTNLSPIGRFNIVGILILTLFRNSVGLFGNIPMLIGKKQMIVFHLFN